MRGLITASLVAVVAASGLTVPAVRAGAAVDGPEATTYLVQLSDPVSDATPGGAGRAGLPEAAARLRTSQDRALRQAGVPGDRITYRYTTAFAGMAVRLTPAQADTLGRAPGVVRLWKDEPHAAQSITTPDFLGLTGGSGVWQRYFTGPGKAGDGVIVGVIDSGIALGHPSFAALPEPRPDAAAIAAKWHGACDPGICNNKVIGARRFRAGATGVAPGEFDSARDYNGHGTHTAAVAVGLNGVPATVDGITVGSTSGVAPTARLAVYKALWQTTTGQLVGSTADIVAAIDQATADGVDIINYSAAGSTTTIADPISVAFYNAAKAGVFIAAAGGNGGVVGNLAPWVTTVATGTHDRTLTRTLQLGDGSLITGVGTGTAAVPATRIVDGAAAAAPPATATDAELCRPGALSPAAVSGAIVLCRRGGPTPLDKSRAVRDSGGAGMVLYNDPDSTVPVDFYPIPTVHLTRADGLRVKAYAAAGTPTAQLAASVRGQVRAPAVAASSAAGPARLPGVPILKPDLLAPGVDVVAATVSAGTPTFGFRSGSSVAAAQVAGAAALLRSRTPTMTPMAVKSALMTTANSLDSAGTPIQRGGQAATPFDQGAGEIRPPASFDPGLTVESTSTDWLSFACTQDPAARAAFGQAACAAVPAAQPRNFNVPSLTDGMVAHTATFRRTVRNATNQVSVYVPDITAPPGYTVTVQPATITVLPRLTAQVTVTVTRTDAVLGTWEFGEVVLADLRNHAVRMPISLRATAVAVPEAVTLTGTGGTATLPVTAGYTGTLNAGSRGPVAPQRVSSTLDPHGPAFNPSTPAPSTRTAAVPVQVPAGGIARIATTAADHGAGVDVDVYVYRGSTSTGWALVGASNETGSAESVTIDQQGDYTVFYHLYTAAAPTPVRGAQWVAPGPSSTLAVSPASATVTAGAAAPLTVTWQGLAPGETYLAFVDLGDGQRPVVRTAVTITT